MYRGLSVLAIVTARGGSKGLPGKNIKLMNDKPLIVWTLEQAKCSEFLDEVFVSTDSEEIADVCRKNGVEVPYLRPEYLATDTASSLDVLDYTIEFLNGQGRHFDYLILLEPTSPLRKVDDIDNIIRLAVEHSDRDGVISVGKVHTEHPMIIKKVSESGILIPYIASDTRPYQRQQHDEALFPYGVGYMIKTDVFKAKKILYTDNMLPYYIERWQNYEIDDIYDFAIIENLMKTRME